MRQKEQVGIEQVGRLTEHFFGSDVPLTSATWTNALFSAAAAGDLAVRKLLTDMPAVAVQMERVL
jgi:hypothetical protein